MLQILLIFSIFLVALFYVLRLVFSPEFASLVLTVVSIVATLTYQEIRKSLGLDGDPLTKRLRMQPLISGLRSRLAILLTYADLSFLILAATLVSVLVFNGFVAAVEDLEAKKFLSFLKPQDGFIHLQIYLGGFVAMPIYILSLGSYGIHRGFVDRRIYFSRLLVAVFAGLLLTLSILFGLRGGSPAAANYDLVAHANQTIYPVGAAPLRTFIVFSGFLVLCLAMTGYTYLAGQFGRALASLYRRFLPR